MTSEQDPGRLAEVAVVVPVRNEATTLGDLVKALLTQTCVPSRIVLVDAGSTDGTRELVSEMARRHEEIEMVDAGPAGPGLARNLGIETVETDLVVLIDAGMWADETLIEELLDVMDAPVRLVLGSRRIQSGSLWRDAAAVTAIKRRRLVDGRWSRFELTPCLLDRGLWVEAGGFQDWRAGEDLEFLDRLDLDDSEVALAPRAEVVWDVALGPARLFRKWTVYAFHNASQGSSWHRPVLLWNVAGAVAAGTAAWLVGPIGLVLGIWPHVVRTAVRVGRYRTDGDREIGGGPLVFVVATMASVLVDLAILRGYVRSLIGRGPREW